MLVTLDSLWVGLQRNVIRWDVCAVFDVILRLCQNLFGVVSSYLCIFMQWNIFLYKSSSCLSYASCQLLVLPYFIFLVQIDFLSKQITMTEINAEAQELLLHSARNGDIVTLESLLRSQAEGKINLDVNCKGIIVLYFFI